MNAHNKKKNQKKSFPILRLFGFPFFALHLRLCSTELPFTYMYLYLHQSVLRTLVSCQTTSSKMTITSNISSLALRKNETELTNVYRNNKMSVKIEKGKEPKEP